MPAPHLACNGQKAITDLFPPAKKLKFSEDEIEVDGESNPTELNEAMGQYFSLTQWLQSPSDMEFDNKALDMIERQIPKLVSQQEKQTKEVDQQCAQLQQASEQGFPAHSSLGTAFQRACKDDPTLKEAYSSEESNKQKAAFRQQWAKKKYDDMRQEKRQKTSWKQVDAEHGTYGCMKVIWDREGGDGPGLQAMKYYVGACLQMGEPWHRHNPLTRR